MAKTAVESTRMNLTKASVQLFRYGLERLALQHHDFGDRVSGVEDGGCADRAGAGVRFPHADDGVEERSLGGAERGTLRFGLREILTAGDRVGLGDLSGLVIDDDFRELAGFHRVDREL